MFDIVFLIIIFANSRYKYHYCKYQSDDLRLQHGNLTKQNGEASDFVKYDYTKAALVLCEDCYWCGSIFKGFDIASFRCPNCRSQRLSSFPIVIDEELIPFKVSINKTEITIS